MTLLRRPRAALSRHRPWPLCRQCSGVALDMGSARTRAWVAGRGMIIDVPTVTFPGAGAVYPIQRGSIVDTQGTARMLDRLLGHRLPRFARPVVVVTAPVLDGLAYRTEARTVVEVLRPEITCRLADRLHVPLRAVPAPHTAAVRGAAKLLDAAHTHPSTTGTDPPEGHPH